MFQQLAQLGGVVYIYGLLALFSALLATASSFSACQEPTTNPLTGCPSNTILVSKTLPKSNTSFTTIQSAILSLPQDTSSWNILILPGSYVEQLNITRAGPLTLLGQTSNSTQVQNNTVTVSWAAADVSSSYSDNAFTSVLTVAPTLDASLTGSGNTGFPVPDGTPFGNTDFRAYNIDFSNTYAQKSTGPSLAVSISRANAGFYYCGVYSYQDTVYIGKLGNAYFYANEIAGQTDFLYGFGTLWAQQSTLLLRSCGGGIIAWKGTNTTIPNKYGAYISDSIVKAANSSIATKIVGKCSLGRPWNAQDRSVYMNTYLDASILPAGYTKWTTKPATDRYNNYTILAEYNSTGPGFNLTARIAGNVTKELTAQQASVYSTPKDVFTAPGVATPSISWIDTAYYPWS